jgi:hypothetical protein
MASSELNTQLIKHIDEAYAMEQTCFRCSTG